MQAEHLAPGIKTKISFVVEEKHLASQMLSGEAKVFATPMLVAGMEEASVALLKPCLAPGQSTVGVHIDAYHEAATPLGMQVTFEATLTAISANGKKFSFSIVAFDDAGPIGRGTHERVLVPLKLFEEKTALKKKR